jgi:hypothetical protein
MFSKHQHSHFGKFVLYVQRERDRNGTEKENRSNDKSMFLFYVHAKSIYVRTSAHMYVRRLHSGELCVWAWE